MYQKTGQINLKSLEVHVLLPVLFAKCLQLLRKGWLYDINEGIYNDLGIY